MKLDKACWARKSIENMVRRFKARNMVTDGMIARRTAKDTRVASLGRTVML